MQTGFTTTDIRSELHRERKRLLVFTHVLALIIFAFHIPVDRIIESPGILTGLDALLFLLILINLYIMIRLERLALAAMNLMMLVGLELLIAVISNIDQADVVKNLYWLVIVAPAAFYLTGRRGGALISSVVLIASWAVHFYYLQDPTSQLGRSSMIDFSGVYLAIAAISFLYAHAQSMNIKRIVHYSQDLAFANDELKVAALTDTLTASYNRKFLDELLHELTSNPKRRDTTFSLIMIDIDHFKNVNDKHGHQVGDDILSAVTKGLQSQLRDNDILGRWGGEEFILISQGLDAEKAMKLAERLRKYIEGFEFPYGLNITCSFGVVEYGQHHDKTELVKLADSALYEAKKAGRNRCVLSV